MLRVLLVSLVFCGALGALQLADETYSFRAEVPDSLPKVRHDPARFPDTLHMFAEPERGGILLQLILLPEELKQVNPVPKAGASDVAVLWKGLTLTRSHRYFPAGATGQAVEVSADVPVAKRGIRISFTGPVRRETEIVGLFAFVLEHFDGRSNWTTLQGGPAKNPPPPRDGTPDVSDSESTESSPNAAIGVAATIALMLGFVGGWWLRGAASRPVSPPETIAKLETPAAKPAVPKAATLPVPAAIAATVKKPPDETDPGTALPKCRVCGSEIRAGKKVCMNCGSEVY